MMAGATLGALMFAVVKSTYMIEYMVINHVCQ